jgi:hypothetical protein
VAVGRGGFNGREFKPPDGSPVNATRGMLREFLQRVFGLAS